MPANTNIVIVHYNHPEDVVECVEHLHRMEDKRWRVYIIDNGSSEKDRDVLSKGMEKYGPIRFSVAEWKQADGEWGTVNLIWNDRNAGYGAAVNMVLGRITGTTDYVWLLNPDVLVKPDTLSHFYSCADTDPAAIWGAMVYDEKDPDKLLYAGGFKVNKWTGTISFASKGPVSLDAVSGGCLFTGVKVISRNGPLPEEYFLYWEDAQWCGNARARGIALKTCRAARCHDKGSTTIGKGFLAEYLYTLNALKYAGKIHKGFILTILFFNIFRALKRLLQFQIKNFQAIFVASWHFVVRRHLDADKLLHKNR